MKPCIPVSSNQSVPARWVALGLALGVVAGCEFAPQGVGGQDPQDPVDSPDSGLSTQPDAFPYTPSNFEPEVMTPVAAITLDCDGPEFNSQSGVFTNWCGQPEPAVSRVTQGDNSDIVVLAMEGLTIAAETTLSLRGDVPIVLAVYGDAAIAGMIDASALGARNGPGAGSCADLDGRANNDNDTGGGGGGGGFGTPGASGGIGEDGGSGGGGGGGLGSNGLVPLRGGCSGGNGAPVASGGPGGMGGGGGGAVQLSAAGMLAIDGVIAAAGGGGGAGFNHDGAGGGGSGGAILLEAVTIALTDNAAVTVNGGGGGEGGSEGDNNDEIQSGQDGNPTVSTPADAGAGGSRSGGDGGAGGALNSGPGDGARAPNRQGDNGGGGGGGGGAVGQIHVNASEACMSTGTPVASPQPTSNGAQGCPSLLL